MIASLVLIFVLITIVCRKWLAWHFPIWAIMLGGAACVLLFQQISFTHALKAIDGDILCYLFGVFVIAEGLDQSGYLLQLTERFFKHTDSGLKICIIIVTITGLSSILLMNDTVAIIGTAVVLELCKKQPRLITPLLLTLAFSITTASVTSPVGNPQNLLIALQGPVQHPFITFFHHLFFPTLLNIVLTLVMIAIFYRAELKKKIQGISNPSPLHDPLLAKLSVMATILLISLIIVNILLSTLYPKNPLRLSALAVIAALPILAFSQNRINVLRRLDWGTLIFFIALFILVQSVWDSGLLQNHLQNTHFVLTDNAVILLVSCLLSQFISNVPMVALYLPLLQHLHASSNNFLALAAGSTIAGNALIFGAASNIIIWQQTEKKGYSAPSFFAFARIGLPLTALQLLVYWIFV